MEMCFTRGPSSDSLRLCVRLGKESELSQNAAQLLDSCLHTVPGTPARATLPLKYNTQGDILQELHRKAKSEAKGGFLTEQHTLEGALSSIRIGAVGVGRNSQVLDRAFYLAMSTAIMLDLTPAKCDPIFNVWGVAVEKMVQEARTGNLTI